MVFLDSALLKNSNDYILPSRAFVNTLFSVPTPIPLSSGMSSFSVVLSGVRNNNRDDTTTTPPPFYYYSYPSSLNGNISGVGGSIRSVRRGRCGGGGRGPKRRYSKRIERSCLLPPPHLPPLRVGLERRRTRRRQCLLIPLHSYSSYPIIITPPFSI